jgi:citrate synthase
VAGWLAHWHEQLIGNRIFRPEQISIGKSDVPFVSLSKRP